MKKISVIIPTFNNIEDVLIRLINSLKDQTMDKSDFDVIFIDDGSNDFTAYKRLKSLTEPYENFYVYRISPSGWSSRPRNKGIELADSKYVFFSDDDDSLFPQALERIYNFAEKNNLDVVNPKVIRTKGWSWGWKEFQKNIVNAETLGVNCMGPMTVPKLYKKTFLVDNQLYFSEGKKVWWEDVMYSCLVYSKNPKIGIYTEYPIYHWREQHVSANFGKDLEYKWKQLNNLAEFFNKHLTSKDRDTMIAHWYNSRVLGTIRKNFHAKKDTTKEIEFKNALAWKEKYVSQNIVDKLNTKNKILDKILEYNDMNLAISFSEMQESITARSYLESVTFEKDEIIFKTNAKVTIDEKSDYKFKGKPNTPKPNLPRELKKVLPKELLIYHGIDSEDNMYLPALKGRFTRATWDIKNVKESNFKYRKLLTNYEVEGKLVFGLKLDEYLNDNIDYHQPYDLATRFSYLDVFSQRAIACEKDFKLSAIINGNTYVVYKNASELVSIDLNSTVKNFYDFAVLKTNNISIDDNSIKIPIQVDHIYGNSETCYLASIYNEKNNDFIETDAILKTNNKKAYLIIKNPKELDGEVIIDIAFGTKSKKIEINI